MYILHNAARHTGPCKVKIFRVYVLKHLIDEKQAHLFSNSTYCRFFFFFHVLSNTTIC